MTAKVVPIDGSEASRYLIEYSEEVRKIKEATWPSDPPSDLEVAQLWEAFSDEHFAMWLVTDGWTLKAFVLWLDAGRPGRSDD